MSQGDAAAKLPTTPRGDAAQVETPTGQSRPALSWLRQNYIYQCYAYSMAPRGRVAGGFPVGTAWNTAKAPLGGPLVVAPQQDQRF